ncbi:MAG: hypothetical protein IJ736_06740 [Firmicutes bacterium]|nr:hypothetical protein [Bacillota bacterium]
MGAKIYVIKMKQIIRVLISIAVICIIAAVIIGLIKNASKPTFKPGVYTSQIILHNSPVNVEVEVSRDAIESVRVLDLSETQQVFYPLFASSADEICSKIVSEQSCDITLSEDNAVTGGIIVDAVRQALEKADPES